MTLFNFEKFFRPEKITKGHEKFLRGHVVDLKKVSSGWEAKIKIGMYNVHTSIKGLTINSSRCNCDDRPWSGYCDHSIAVLFAIRKELNYFTFLSSKDLKLPCTEERITDLLSLQRDPDFETGKSYIKLLSTIVEKVLGDMEKAVKKKKYADAGGLGFHIINCIQKFNDQIIYDQYERSYRQADYQKGYEYIDKVFELLKEIWLCPLKPETRDDLAYDSRLSFIRNFRTDNSVQENWMDLLLLTANDEGRKEKIIKIIDTFCQIEEAYPGSRYDDNEEEPIDWLQYKEKVIQIVLAPDPK